MRLSERYRRWHCVLCGRRLVPGFRAHIGRWSHNAPRPWSFEHGVIYLHDSCRRLVLRGEEA